MREIKFRAWHPPITDGEVTLPGHMDYELEHRKYTAVRTETRQPPESFGFEHVQTGSYFINQDLAKYGDRLMQYTGLKDKNGKEIYEGDIMKMPNDGYLFKVEWYVSKWEFFTASGHFGESFSGFSDEYEIIGNIYENPDLLPPSEESNQTEK